MKIKTASCVICLVFMICTNIIHAQYQKRGINESGFYILSGLSIIDDGFTVTNNPLAFSDRWNYGFFIGFELELTQNISTQVVFSRNFYREGNIVDNVSLPSNLIYESYDVLGLYSFTEELNLKKYLEPYLIAGLGSTIIDNDNRFTVNYGLGFRIWMWQWAPRKRNILMQGLGFSGQVLGKSGLGQRKDGRSYGGQIQHTLGIIYQF